MHKVPSMSIVQLAYQNRHISQHWRGMHSVNRWLMLSRCVVLTGLLAVWLVWLSIVARLRAAVGRVGCLLLAWWTPWLRLPSIHETVQGSLIGCKHCCILRLGVLSLHALCLRSLLCLRERARECSWLLKELQSLISAFGCTEWKMQTMHVEIICTFMWQVTQTHCKECKVAYVRCS